MAKASSPLKIQVVASAVLVLALATDQPRHVAARKGALDEFTRWHVYVVNGLTNNDLLFVHCKSRDDDLGIHNLPPGTNFTWSFRQNIFHRTLFWCYMHKYNAHVAFKAFWQDAHLFYQCLWTNCIWIAKDDGIFIRDLDRGCEELRHNWEPGLRA